MAKLEHHTTLAFTIKTEDAWRADQILHILVRFLSYMPDVLIQDATATEHEAEDALPTG